MSEATSHPAPPGQHPSQRMISYLPMKELLSLHSWLLNQCLLASYVQASLGGTLLTTCQMLVHATDGTHVNAQGLLDARSSTFFVSERLAQLLRLPLSAQSVRISGITCMSRSSPLQSSATFSISLLFHLLKCCNCLLLSFHKSPVICLLNLFVSARDGVSAASVKMGCLFSI